MRRGHRTCMRETNTAHGQLLAAVQASPQRCVALNGLAQLRVCELHQCDRTQTNGDDLVKKYHGANVLHFKCRKPLVI